MDNGDEQRFTLGMQLQLTTEECEHQLTALSREVLYAYPNMFDAV